MGDLLNDKGGAFPKITIGMVVYNGVAHMRSALDSLMQQSYKNIELIVIDGDSKDGTLNVLNEYAKRISVIVSEPDKGIYDAMNKVCTLATGDWLIFLGCDDVLLDSLGAMAKKMTDPDTVYHGDAIFRSSGNIYGGKFSKYRLARQNFCHQAMFYPRAVYKKKFYSLDYKWLADYVYNIQLAGKGIHFVYVPTVVSIYNDKGGSSEGDAGFEKIKIGLIHASFGLRYALIERLRKSIERSADKAVITSGAVLKSLLPYRYWKYLQSMWRSLRKKY